MAASADLVLTTCGTGIAAREVTPEATLSVIEKQIPGITEVMRMKSIEVAPTAMLSRAVAGTLGSTLIVNLPGSPKAVRECLSFIKPGHWRVTSGLRLLSCTSIPEVVLTRPLKQWLLHCRQWLRRSL